MPHNLQLQQTEDEDILHNPEAAHPRARELMAEEFFRDFADEDAPFGSDEGDTALYECRDWWQSHAGVSLVDCFSWIMSGRQGEYNEDLLDDARLLRFKAIRTAHSWQISMTCSRSTRPYLQPGLHNGSSMAGSMLMQALLAAAADRLRRSDRQRR